MSETRTQWRAILSRPVDVEPFDVLSSVVALEVGAASRTGRLQTRNTDHYLAVRLGRTQETVVTSLGSADLPSRFEEYAYAMLVADGLGEDAAGARASRVALSALAHLGIEYGRWNVRVDPDVSSIFRQGEFLYRRANDAVREASQADLRLADMATSLTALYVAGDDLFFAHVGHSRAFLFREGVLTRMTVDHTVDEQQRVAGRPMPLRRAKRDFKHMVTEAIGGRPVLPGVDIEHFKLMPSDRLLLCTNGLTDVVSEEEIADVLALGRSPEQDCLRLCELAAAADAPDDVTMMIGDYTLRPAATQA
jgi:protein phosphatase